MNYKISRHAIDQIKKFHGCKTDEEAIQSFIFEPVGTEEIKILK